MGLGLSQLSDSYQGCGSRLECYRELVKLEVMLLPGRLQGCSQAPWQGWDRVPVVVDACRECRRPLGQKQKLGHLSTPSSVLQLIIS